MRALLPESRAKNGVPGMPGSSATGREEGLQRCPAPQLAFVCGRGHDNPEICYLCDNDAIRNLIINYITMEEIQTPTPAPAAPELKVTSPAKSYLATTTKWGKFLYVVFLILFVFMALCSILFLVLGKEPIEDTPAFAFGIAFLVGIALYIAPLIFFGRSLKAAKAAVESDDDAQLTEAFKNQKSLLKYTGILTIVLLAFYVVVLIAVIVAAISGAFAGAL